jgi:peptidoglycan/LPS O-acetylase OafA/YrhL
MLLFGVAGWHHARHLEKKYGVSAWGMPSWVWGVITAFSLLIGAILLHLAEKPLKRREALSFADQQSAYTRTAADVAVPAMAGAAPAAAAGVAAGWHPDPSGRHQLRWWDGERWTTNVHDDGVTSTEG